MVTSFARIIAVLGVRRIAVVRVTNEERYGWWYRSGKM